MNNQNNQNNQGSLFDSVPTEPMVNLGGMSGPENFINAAQAAGAKEPQPQPQPQPEPEQPKQVEPEISIGISDKARINSAVNLGPKYMEALKQLDDLESIKNTKTISVQLPMSMKKVQVTSITGAEEQVIKTTNASPNAFMKKVDELLYNHTTFEDGSKPTFKEFLEEIYPPDKSTLIYALLASSYVVLPELERTCEHCEANNLIKSVPSDMIHEDTFQKVWDKELSPADYTIVQEVFDGYIRFEFGIPNEKDNIIITGMIQPDDMKDNIARSGQTMTQLDILAFFTRSITVGEPGNQLVLTDIAKDIYPFLKGLSPKVADGIRSTVDVSVFDEYMPNFYLEKECQSCGATMHIDTDPELLFFRKSMVI